MIGAVALVACAATDNSVKPTYAEESWFGAKVTNGEIDPDRGEFKIKEGGESTFEPTSDNKIEIDSEISDPVSFVLKSDTKALTTTLARVTFELDPAVVPFSARPTDLENVKVAFALCEEASGADTNFYAWVNGDWNKLNFTIPTDTYELTMSFNESDSTAKKVQFSKGTQVSDWYNYTEGLGKPQIDFVGSGKITQLAAAQLKFVSADVDFNGQSVKIAGDDMDAMKKLVTLDGETLETALAKPVSEKVVGIVDTCNLTVAEAYAIGLIANEGGTMVAKADGTFKVKADATATTTSGIKVGFATPLTANDKTASISYTLKGSKDGTSWSDSLGGPWNDPDDIVIPTAKVTEGFRYFKVVTTVDLTTKN